MHRLSKSTHLVKPQQTNLHHYCATILARLGPQLIMDVGCPAREYCVRKINALNRPWRVLGESTLCPTQLWIPTSGDRKPGDRRMLLVPSVIYETERRSQETLDVLCPPRCILPSLLSLLYGWIRGR